jgi:hypothetical protein
MAQSVADKKIVPVEIVEDHAASWGSGRVGSSAWKGQFRIVLADGLGVEIEPGFDASELRRLITALNGVDLRGSLPRPE